MRRFLVAAMAAALVAPAALSHADGDAMPEPLTDLARVELSMAAGAAVFADREQGHCVLCHEVSSLDAPFQGNVGPAMDGIGSRLTPAQIRYRIVDASMLNPDTIMPPYYRTEGLTQVAADYRGQPALSAAQIEQLVYYLSRLEE
jgi:sulfur-oxidizing protein SoxX